MNHNQIISSQFINQVDHMNRNPSEVTAIYWLYAKRIATDYPKHTKNSGKWLIFSNNNNIDLLWMKIKKATENGLLGRFSKVATAKPNSNAPNQDMKVICVYTYDYKDIYDVFKIRTELRKLGIVQAIPYKTDLNTLKGKYAVKGNKRISTYYE